MKASLKLKNRPEFFQNFMDKTLIVSLHSEMYLQCYKDSLCFKIVNHVRKKPYWFFNWGYSFIHFFKILGIDLTILKKLKRKRIDEIPSNLPKDWYKKSEQNPVDLSLRDTYLLPWIFCKSNGLEAKVEYVELKP